MDKTVKKEGTLFFKKLELNFLSMFKKAEEDEGVLKKRELLSEIENAISDLRRARECFEEARDPEMIEACIYEIKSAEAKYSFLLRKAKRLAEHEKLKI